MLASASPLIVAAAASTAAASSTSLVAHPNFFFLLTDDQDTLLGGAAHMPAVRELLVAGGANFTNAFVHTPICCPSRSSYLTGRYLQNSLTIQNDAYSGCGNATWAAGPEQRTFAVHLHAAGYATSYAGKYLNTYALPNSAHCPSHNAASCFTVPPGWSDWHGLQGNSRYYNGTISDNGVMSIHGDRPVEDYLPDIFFNHTRSFVASQLGKIPRVPWLAVLATPSCHGPFTPAPKHRGAFAGSSAPRTPNFNASQASIDAKQWLIRQQSPLTAEVVRDIDSVHNQRLETLLSVDSYLKEIFTMVSNAAELDQTYFLYTSDHGFQLGQHRLPSDKRHLYEHDIRIPFFIAGPGVTAGSTVDAPVLSIDVAPTLVDLATGAVPDDMDGASFAPLLRAAAPSSGWRTDFLVSYYGMYGSCGLQKCPPPPASAFHENDGKNNTYHCVRTLNSPHLGGADEMYCEFDDDEHFLEFYEHGSDPWQLDNCAAKVPPAKIAGYHARLSKLRACAGVACRR